MAIGGLGLVAGVGLAVASRVFYVYIDPKIVAVEEALPGANCGRLRISGMQRRSKRHCKGRRRAECMRGRRGVRPYGDRCHSRGGDQGERAGDRPAGMYLRSGKGRSQVSLRRLSGLPCGRPPGRRLQGVPRRVYRPGDLCTRVPFRCSFHGAGRAAGGGQGPLHGMRHTASGCAPSTLSP